MQFLAILFTLAALALALAVIGVTLATNGMRIVEALLGPILPVDGEAEPRANILTPRTSSGAVTPEASVARYRLPLAA